MASEIAPPEIGEAEGCIQCQQGSKLVLFVTGKCHWGCDYCPLSDNRRETPDMFANERRCSNFDEVIEGENFDFTINNQAKVILLILLFIITFFIFYPSLLVSIVSGISLI